MSDAAGRRRTGPGAHSSTGRSKSPLGWLPWAAVLLLLLLALLVVLVVRNVGDSDKPGAVATQTDSPPRDGDLIVATVAS